jgi:single-strand DNA-binding protein
MNKVILIGRLVKDPEVKTTQSGAAVCSFTVAVDRKFRNKDGERQADFLSCVAWKQQAEILGKYFQKGSKIGIVGNVQTRNYEDGNGKKVYVTEVVVDEIEFVESKGERQEKSSYPAAPTVDTAFYATMSDDTDMGVIPFDL